MNHQIRFYSNSILLALCGWMLTAGPLSAQSVRVPGFLPSTSGLRFDNSFPAVPLLTINVLGIQVPIGNAANGLCGGMVFTVRDYHDSGLPVPCDAAPPTGGTLFDYIVRRLFDSFNLPGGPAEYLNLMDPGLPDHETWASQAGLAPHGRAWVMIVEEWPKIKADLDRSTLSPMALIRVKSLDAFQMGENHQVLAYGYNLDASQNLTIFVYDPNHHDKDDVTIVLNIGDPAHTTPVTYDGGADPAEQTYCFFHPDYLFFPPPFLPDLTPPTISSPGNFVVTASPGSCSAQLSYPLPFASDACSPPVTVQCSPASGSLFPLGLSTVNCTATDAVGNINRCSFMVTVMDVTPPSIACPTSIMVPAPVGSCSLQVS